MICFDFCDFILMFRTMVLGYMSPKLSLRRMNDSYSRGFVKMSTMWLSYETFVVEMFLNEHFYQGDDDGSQYVN